MFKFIALTSIMLTSLYAGFAHADGIPCPPGETAACAQIAYRITAASIEVNTARKMLAASNSAYERHPDAAHKTMVDEDQMRLNAAIARQ